MIREEVIRINNLLVNYKITGKGEPLLILHGWGGSSNSWLRVLEYLKNNFLIVCPDLPGFGKTSPPPKPWTLLDYTHFIKNFISEFNFKEIFLLGHSFGGRIAIKFSVIWPKMVKKLILCSSAGIKEKLKIWQNIIFYFSLVGNAIFSRNFLKRFEDKAKNLFYIFFRNLDYGKAKGVMKETMKNILAEDLLPEIEKITSNTLIVWGENDNILPIKFAFLFKEKIKNSELQILPKIKHSPHLEDPSQLSKVILEFLKK